MPNNSPVGALATGLQAYTALNGDMTAVPFTPVTAWTPNLQINGSSAGITYTTRVGAYQQIGNAVHISCNIVLSNKGASNGNVTISNLPVTTGAAGANNTIVVSGSSVTLTANYTNLQINFANASAVGTLFESGSTQVTANVTDAMLANTSVIQFSGVYFIN
jgi:hypothetical protein